MDVTLKPIGHLQSVFKFKNGTPRQPSVCPNAKGKLTIDKSLYNNPEHSIQNLENFSHVWIIFVFHKNNNCYSKAKVKPPRLNGERVGLFSTRSPYRPNPIGLTLAKLEQIEGATLYFSGIDILDGTPVLDIKPYIPSYDNPEYSSHVTSDIPVQDFKPNDRSYDNSNVTSSDIPVLDNKPNNTSYDNPEYSPHVILSGDSDTENPPEAIMSPENDSVLSVTISHHQTDHVICKGNEGYLDTCDNAHHFLHKNSNDENLASFVESNSEHKIISSMTDKNSNVGKHCVFPLNRIIVNTNKTSVDTDRKDEDMASDNSVDTSCFSSFKRAFQNSSNEVQTIPNNNKICDNFVHASPQPSDGASSSGCGTVADWVENPPVSNLSVVFTPRALEQLGKFNKNCVDDTYRLRLFDTANEAMKAIYCILKEDPRSIYRRNQCRDRLYFFSVDTVHVTCWFDDSLVEIVRIKSLVQVEQLN